MSASERKQGTMIGGESTKFFVKVLNLGQMVPNMVVKQKESIAKDVKNWSKRMQLFNN